jgi:raffinose/stachyose/melibiose transport system permease protein
MVRNRKKFMSRIYRKKIRYFIPLFLLAGIIIYTVFLVVPIFNSMFLSFYTGSGMSPSEFTGFGNYTKLFTQFPFKDRFFNAFRNNVKFFLIVTLIQNVIGFFMAVLISRKFLGSRFFRRISFLPTTLSVLVVGFLFSLMLNPVWGFFDKILEFLRLDFLIRPWLGDPATALPVIAIVVSWQFMGESILFYTAGIDAIDIEILEAARIDGAGPLAEIRYIIFPSLLPIIGIVTILIFIGDFTQFDIVYAMATSMGNPAYSTDLFGSLFYRAAFSSPERGGWGMGMGAAVAAIMFLIVFVGVVFWLYVFRMRGLKNKEGA